MKTKFKDFLLYSLACVGAVSLFLSAYQPQESTPKYTMVSSAGSSYVNMYVLNQETGEIKLYMREKEFSTHKKD